jgi:hypothetical protein
MTTRTDSILELEDRAKKMEALAALLRDPALNEVVSKLFGEAQVSVTTNPSSRKPRPLPVVLAEAIRMIAGELPGPFTASEVVSRLKERQFVFRRPALDATRDALYRLTHGKRRQLRIVEVGEAGKPNRYELVS